MRKNILDIYTEYKIMPNLQLHMLRVAAVASIICDNFIREVNKEKIIFACLLHDMGNIIKSNLLYFPEFNEPEGIDYWENVKSEYIKKYGDNEHNATLKIMEELGATPEYISIVDKIDFVNVCDHSMQEDFIMKIVVYADMRVDPKGVVSYEGRMNEAKKRYKTFRHLTTDKQREKLFSCGQDIEKQIFSKCRIKPEDINDEIVEPIISSLKDFVIK